MFRIKNILEKIQLRLRSIGADSILKKPKSLSRMRSEKVLSKKEHQVLDATRIQLLDPRPLFKSQLDMAIEAASIIRFNQKEDSNKLIKSGSTVTRNMLVKVNAGMVPLSLGIIVMREICNSSVVTLPKE